MEAFGKVNAVVLCGGRVPEQLKDRAENKSKAFIKLGGRTLASYVMDAVEACPRIGRTLMVGDPAALKAEFEGRVEIVPQGETIMDNIVSAFKLLDPSLKTLIVTSDLPLITGESLTNTLNDFSPHQADVYYPIIAKERNDQVYPNMRRTYMKLKEGCFTGGNVMLFDTAKVLKKADKINRIFDARKSPLKLVSMIGASFIVKFLTHSLTIRGLENKVGEILGVKARAIVTKEVDIAVDIDKVSDLEVAEAVLKSRESAR